jgi:hypothetical protein
MPNAATTNSAAETAVTSAGRFRANGSARANHAFSVRATQPSWPRTIDAALGRKV